MKNDMLISLNADPAATLTPEQLRERSQNFMDAFNGITEMLDEPLRGQFAKIKEQINKALNGLAETDKVPAAMDAHYVLACLKDAFQMAQSQMAAMNDKIRAAKEKADSAMNSLSAEVDKAINAKVTAGELIKKDDHAAAITTAVSAALNSAKTEWESGIKVAADRKTALASAKLPVPADNILSLNADDWTTREASAKARTEKLAPFKLDAATVTKMAWEATDSEFEISLNCLTEAVKSAPKKGAGQDPFIPGSPAGGDATPVSDTKMGVL